MVVGALSSLKIAQLGIHSFEWIVEAYCFGCDLPVPSNKIEASGGLYSFYVQYNTSNITKYSTEFENIRHCVKQSYRREGIKAFYRGLGINAIRILPGTCVTFVT